MLLFHRYTKTYSLQTAKSGERLLNDLQHEFKNPQMTEEGITIDHQPLSLKFWEGQGRIRLLLQTDREGNTIVESRITPGLSHLDWGQLIFFVLIGILAIAVMNWGVIRYTILGAAILGAGMMLVAPYLLFFLLLGGIVLCVFSFDPFALGALLLGWLFFILMLHVQLRHNRKILEEKLARSMVRM
jgi:hypothetical protein